MSRSFIPSYRKHTSGQARVTLKDPVTGQRKDVMLGKYGSPESKSQYGRVIQAWEAAGRRLIEAAPKNLTVAEMLVPFWEHIEKTYRHEDGTPTGEVDNFYYALMPLRELYDHTPASDFGPVKLKLVRQRMIDRGLCRSQVNARINRIRRAFKFAVENELIPPSVLHGLQAVEGVRRGRGIREAKAIKPVAIEIVEATIPHLPKPVAAIVRLLQLTAARTGELVLMRTGDLEIGSRVWIYRPRRHKTAHRGKPREIYLGPKAQDVLKPWLKLDLQAYIFSPAEAERIRHSERSRLRKTPRWQSHERRNVLKRVAKRRRPPAERYDTKAVRTAINRACDKAFLLPSPLCRSSDETIAEWQARLSAEQKLAISAWRREHRWHPHQLRHTAGTLLRKEHGIEMARIILGHSSAFTTEIYAEVDRDQAVDVIAKIG